MELQVIQSKIYEIRGRRVMLDFDLAQLYGVTTGNLNKAVKRNIERFPERFMFQLNKEEILLFQNGIASWGGSRTMPYAFTEQGVSMLSAVLRSSVAVQVSISIGALNDLSESTREDIDNLYQAIGELSLKVAEQPKRSRKPIGYIRKDEHSE